MTYEGAAVLEATRWLSVHRQGRPSPSAWISAGKNAAKTASPITPRLVQQERFVVRSARVGPGEAARQSRLERDRYGYRTVQAVAAG